MRYLLKKHSFKSILDVGCGPAFASEIAKESRGCEAVLLDMNDWRDKVEHIGNFYQLDFMNYPFSQQFDHVFCSHSFEHQLNPEAFLKLLIRFLKDDGLLTIIVPPFDYTDGIIAGHVNQFTVEVLLHRMVLAGLDCSVVECFNFPGNIGVAVKKKMIYLTNEEANPGKYAKSLWDMRRYFPQDAQWHPPPTYVMKITNFVNMKGLKVGPWSEDERV
jgi:SAM-dependent methyltransferase